MIRLFVLLSLVSCIEISFPHLTSSFKKPNYPVTYPAPIALVKYKEMIYHCHDISKTPCGYSIHCNELTYHCVNDIVIEYLK